ncbi:MAG: retropepsin-like aspartic protease family protein [Vulcanimicrobiaceae bacterium]
MSSGVRAPAADDAQSLLAKNKAFAGWTFGDPSMDGLRLTGNVGKRQILDLRRGAIWHATYTDDKLGVSNDIGYTGKLFWSTNQNGFTVPVLADGVRYELAFQILMNQGIPLLPGTLRGKATVDGVQTQIVRVEEKDAFPIDAYLDPQSGKLLRAVIDPDGSASTFDILGYLDLDGKKIISKWKVGDTTAEFTKAEHAKIPDEAFHPPTRKAVWEFAPPEPMPITVSRDRISLRASINGVEGNFIFDSGASGITLNADFGDRAKVKVLKATTTYGLNGATNASIARADTIKIGGNVLHNVIISVGTNAHGRWEDFDGLIGFDFLAGAIVDIDVPKQKMTIFDPAKYAVNVAGPALPLDLRRGWATVPATLDGRVKAHLSFDTGDPMSVFVTDSLYGGGRGVQMRLEGYARMGGAGGDSQQIASCGRIESIEIGKINYGNVPICFGRSKVLFGNDQGIIGLDFIKHFDLTFDYPDGLLYLTPLGK